MPFVLGYLERRAAWLVALLAVAVPVTSFHLFNVVLKVPLLAQFGAKRLPDYADVPTLKELGYNVEYASWLTIMAPAATPAPIVARLRDAFLKVGNDPQFGPQMAKIGEPVEVRSGEQFAAFWDKEYAEMDGLLQITPAEQGPEDHPDDFTDRATGQAVDRGAQRGAVER